MVGSTRRTKLIVGTLIWAVLGGMIALSSFDAVNNDARLLVAFATVGGPLAATAAAWALRKRSDRTAGVLLLISVLTPTYFAAIVLNLPALVAGALLLTAPTMLLRSRDAAIPA